jgi:hypothetical protein
MCVLVVGPVHIALNFGTVYLLCAYNYNKEAGLYECITTPASYPWGIAPAVSRAFY